MVLYLLTKFGIIRPWTNIPWPRDSIKSLYRLQNKFIENLIIGRKFLGCLKGFSCFPRKMVLYLLTNFETITLWINFPWLRRFDLGCWQTSKQIYRKFQYRGKVFGEFQGFPCFPRKTVLYSLTKFGIIKPWTNISWLRTLN